MRDAGESFWVFRHFNKIFTGMIILIVCIWIGSIALAWYVGNEISERGLKSVVEEIWEGPEAEDD